MLWLDHFLSINDKPVVARFRGGIGVREQPGFVTASFVGHPVHFRENGEWQPITLAHLGGRFVGSRWGFKNGIVTLDGDDFSVASEYLVDGAPLKFKSHRIDQPNACLISENRGYVHKWQIWEGGIREILEFTDNIGGLVTVREAEPMRAHDFQKRKLTAYLRGELQSEIRAVKGMVIDPDYTANDGGDIRGFDADYPTARNTYQGASSHTGQAFSGGNYYVMRSGTAHDTSGISDSASVNQVNLKLTAIADQSATDFDVDVVKAGWSAPLGSDANFDLGLSADLDDSIWRNTNGMSINTQYTSGNLATAWVSKTGTTRYMLVSSRDRAGTAPSGSEYIDIAAYDHATPGYRPVLTVTYTEGYAFTVTGTVSSSGIITTRTITTTKTGALTPSGTVLKALSTNFSGAVAIAGTVAKRIQTAFSGAVTVAGTITKQIQKTLTGVVSIVGSLITGRAIKLFAKKRDYNLSAEARDYTLTAEKRDYNLTG